MKRLQASGLGTLQRKGEVISYENEEIMWQKGIEENRGYQVMSREAKQRLLLHLYCYGLLLIILGYYMQL